jgi:hypothetical protein
MQPTQPDTVQFRVNIQDPSVPPLTIHAASYKLDHHRDFVRFLDSSGREVSGVVFHQIVSIDTVAAVPPVAPPTGTSMGASVGVPGGSSTDQGVMRPNPVPPQVGRQPVEAAAAAAAAAANPQRLT